MPSQKLEFCNKKEGKWLKVTEKSFYTNYPSKHLNEVFDEAGMEGESVESKVIQRNSAQKGGGGAMRLMEMRSKTTGSKRRK